jgi:hypothetical protein
MRVNLDVLQTQNNGDVRGIPMELWVVVLNPTLYQSFRLLDPRALEMPADIKAMPMEGVRAWTQQGGTTVIIAE